MYVAKLLTHFFTASLSNLHHMIIQHLRCGEIPVEWPDWVLVEFVDPFKQSHHKLQVRTLIQWEAAKVKRCCCWKPYPLDRGLKEGDTEDLSGCGLRWDCGLLYKYDGFIFVVLKLIFLLRQPRPPVAARHVVHIYLVAGDRYGWPGTLRPDAPRRPSFISCLVFLV